MLAVGDLAPDFALPDSDGNTFTLAGVRGKKVILYFYPKDNTPGCTQEACDFRDHHLNFADHNALIVGISKDTATSHRNFKDKHDLPFMLLTDHDGKVCTLYDVIQEGTMFGKTYLGIQRTTVLIDEQGKIAAIWPKVTVKNHVASVLASLEAAT